ncbi:cell division protein FtsQ/DivIB [Neisseria leonii]|uniref:cell division protein FtsQ/DivIB n=1 Tax=Neisseria leonii TaxID=2995413 RepID=UPI0030CC0797
MWNNASAMRRISGWLTVLLFLLLLAAGGAWLYHSPYFPIKQVVISGDIHHTDEAVLQKIAKQYIRGNILRADLNGAQTAYAALPWLAEAQVRRRLPDTVEIVLRERIAVARWGEEAGRLVDTEGTVFAGEVAEPLPQLVGEAGAARDMVAHLSAFQTALSREKLAVRRLVYTPRSAWELVLDNGLTVRLGREDEHARLARFIAVWQPVLREQAPRLQYVDMRYKDGFAVRAKPADEAAPDQAASAAAAAPSN